MTQRDSKFKGGIQAGTVAMDSYARNLDNQCKQIKNTLAESYSSTLTMQRKLRKDQIPGGLGACEPDGGLWFRNGKLVAVFEAKKQGRGGNAIERWFKNNYIARLINPNVCYVTFCIGEGAAEGCVLRKTLDVAHLEGFDQFNKNKNSAYFSVNGFTEEEISDIMRTVLNYCTEED
jgi:hypothetical protein